MKETLKSRLVQLLGRHGWTAGIADDILPFIKSEIREEVQVEKIAFLREAANEGITMDNGTRYHLVPDWLLGARLLDAFEEKPVATPMDDPAADVPLEEAEVEVADDWSSITITGTPALVRRMLHIEDPE